MDALFGITVKRYSKNPALIVLNIIIEYGLIILTYLICGAIRLCIQGSADSVVREFHAFTIWRFVPAILVLGLVMIGTFMMLGDYNSLHFRNTRKILIETFTVSAIGGLGMATAVFMSNDEGFSRLLLLMLIAGWTLILFGKRLLLEQLANRIFAGRITATRIALVGTGRNARKYYEGLRVDTSTRWEFVGYLADHKSEAVENYLGNVSDLGSVLSSMQIDKLVIAEDEENAGRIKEILNICGMYGIEVDIIPIYADYIAEGQSVKKENGLHYIGANAGLTSDILGVNISVTDMDKTLAEIEDNLETWRGKYICVSNVHTTVMAHDDETYRAIQNGAIRALPDGGPLSSYSRSEGKTEAKRVTGPDLMREALKKSKDTGWRHFFYGSSEKTLELLKKKIEDTYPGAEIAGMISPPYRDITPSEDEAFVSEINASKPDFVWVGLGAPKQEIWMAAHKDKINALMVGVGAAFDYESGNLKRAPKWMQKCNLEWLYRFMQEPRRLFKRYFVTNIKFLWLTRR